MRFALSVVCGGAKKKIFLPNPKMRAHTRTHTHTHNLPLSSTDEVSWPTIGVYNNNKQYKSENV
jgi:hypothetical protein